MKRICIALLIALISSAACSTRQDKMRPEGQPDSSIKVNNGNIHFSIYAGDDIVTCTHSVSSIDNVAECIQNDEGWEQLYTDASDGESKGMLTLIKDEHNCIIGINGNWFTVSIAGEPENNLINVHVDENDSGRSRKFVVTLFVKGQYPLIGVTQD